jgi:hypothetical protein
MVQTNHARWLDAEGGTMKQHNLGSLLSNTPTACSPSR